MKKILKRIYLNFRDVNKWILVLTILLSVVGVFLILSASSITAKLSLGDTYYYFRKQLFILIGSLVLSFITMNFFSTKSYHVIGKWGTIVLSAFLVIKIFQGFILNTSNSEVSINLGFISLQPAEFIKVLIILYLGSSYYKWSLKEKHFKFDFLIPLVPAVIPVLFILISGDKGSAITMMLIVGIMFLFVPTDDKTFKIVKIITITLMLVCFVILKFAYLIVDEDSNSYLLNRLNYVNPCDRYEKESGYQVCNGYIAIDNGGLFGVGIGNSTQKYLYLPASHTDFIFPIIVEELGLIISTLIIVAYMFIAYNIFKVASNSYNLKNSLTAFGIGIYFLVHIFINLGGVLGLIPLTGIPLPLLSYGGSSLLAMFLSFAIVQRICIENKKMARINNFNKIKGK